jgi:hypothetical protein
VTTLEIELVKAKEQVGDAMNTVNELEGMEMSGQKLEKKPSYTQKMKSFFSYKKTKDSS